MGGAPLDKPAAAQARQIQQDIALKMQEKNKEESRIFIPGMRQDGRFFIPE